MKLLREIDSGIYGAGLKVCTEPVTIEDRTEVLFIARFLTDEGNIALEGLVLARGDGYTEVDFRQANNDGEAVGKTYRAQIDSLGILGQLVLTDDEVLHASEGYFLRYGDRADDELTRELDKLLVEDDDKKLPAQFHHGGAQTDLAKRHLRFDRQNREFGI